MGLVGRLHPAVWFLLGWLGITLLAHFGHLDAGGQRIQLDWGAAIAAGFALSGVAMLTWWIAYGRT